MLMVANWTCLTNHAGVPLCIAHDPGVRLRDIAASLGITERTAYDIRHRPGRGRPDRQAEERPPQPLPDPGGPPLPEPTRRERTVRCAALRHPEHAASISRVLAIPPSRWDRTIVTFLTEPETDALLATPDRSAWTGRRDQALLLRDPKLPPPPPRTACASSPPSSCSPKATHGCPPKPDQIPAPDQLQADNPLVPGERERHGRGGTRIPRADPVRAGARRGGRAPRAGVA